jgi:hypothetical protein
MVDFCHADGWLGKIKLLLKRHGGMFGTAQNDVPDTHDGLIHYLLS